VDLHQSGTAGGFFFSRVPRDRNPDCHWILTAIE